MPDSTPNPAASRVGLFYALGAYLWWGLIAPNYFKLVAHVPAPLVLAHRIIWSVLLLTVLLAASKQIREALAALRQPRLRIWLLVSTILIAINWIVFIHAIATHRLIEASIGYFINPILTVLLGMLFLNERLRRPQWAAILIAALGLVVFALARGLGAADSFPWIAFVLPISFGLYSLIRKRTPVSALAGLFVETAMLAPAALIYLVWAHAQPDAATFNTPGSWSLLALAGVVTTVPLLWFVAGAQRLSFTTIGFLQFINPTLQFLTAVLIFGEPLTRSVAIALGVIWLAVGVFIADSIFRARHA